jgi:hypothetical protein
VSRDAAQQACRADRGSDAAGSSPAGRSRHRGAIPGTGTVIAFGAESMTSGTPLYILTAGGCLTRHPFAAKEVIYLGFKHAAVIKRGLRRHVFKRQLSNATADAAFTCVVQAGYLPSIRANVGMAGWICNEAFRKLLQIRYWSEAPQRCEPTYSPTTRSRRPRSMGWVRPRSLRTRFVSQRPCNAKHSVD